jgi:hypothetical protein
MSSVRSIFLDEAFIRRDKAGQDVLYSPKNLGMQERYAPRIWGTERLFRYLPYKDHYLGDVSIEGEC